MEEKRPGPIPVLGEAAENYLVQWAILMKKKGILLIREAIIQMASEIHRYMLGSVRSVGSVGWG